MGNKSFEKSIKKKSNNTLNIYIFFKQKWNLICTRSIVLFVWYLILFKNYSNEKKFFEFFNTAITTSASASILNKRKK